MQPSSLIAFRKEKKLSQLDVATIAGISKAAYSNIETGKRMPSIRTACRIAHVLGSTVEELFGAEAEISEKNPNGN